MILLEILIMYLHGKFYPQTQKKTIKKNLESTFIALLNPLLIEQIEFGGLILFRHSRTK